MTRNPFPKSQSSLYLFCRSKRDQAASKSGLRSDFFMYDIAACKWTLVCDDTAEIGGPSLIYDHQMCLDPENQNIYVFGGQTVQGLSSR